MTRAAILLAGGLGRRLGTPKATAPVAGVPMLSRALATVRSVVDLTIVVAREPDQELPPLPPGVVVVFDETPGAGPLRALQVGLDRAAESGAELCFVLACDLPNLTTASVEALFGALEDSDQGLVPTVSEIPQPLCSVVRSELRGALREAIQGGSDRAMTLARLPGVRLLEGLQLERIDPDGGFGMDVDTPEDLRIAERRIHDRSSD